MLASLTGLNRPLDAPGSSTGDWRDAAPGGGPPVLKKRKLQASRPSAEGASLLWVDKYRPLYMDELELHTDFSDLMQRACESKELPHLLLYGPSGAGKMTRVYAILRQIFGHSVDDSRTALHTVQHPAKTGSKFEICVKSSLYHMELHLPDVGIRDVKVAKTIVKDFTMGKPLNGAAFKVIVLKGADRMSRECQTALRRLIEVRSQYCRFIFVSSSIGSMILPIQSRCFPFRLPLPTDPEIEATCKDVLKKEHLENLIPAFNFVGVIQSSGNDLRKALLIMETMVTAGNFTDVQVAPWERICREIAQSVIRDDASPRTILEIRSKMYTLLSATVSGETILNTVCCEICRIVPAATATVWHIASVYDVLLHKCGKEIFALEAFVARTLAWIAGEKKQQAAQQQQRAAQQ